MMSLNTKQAASKDAQRNEQKGLPFHGCGGLFFFFLLLMRNHRREIPECHHFITFFRVYQAFWGAFFCPLVSSSIRLEIPCHVSQASSRGLCSDSACGWQSSRPATDAAFDLRRVTRSADALSERTTTSLTCAAASQVSPFKTCTYCFLSTLHAVLPCFPRLEVGVLRIHQRILTGSAIFSLKL